MRARNSDATADLEATAAIVQRLAVLLAAGVAPASAWGYLAEPSGAGGESAVTGSVASRLKTVIASVGAGVPIADAILRAVDPNESGAHPGAETPSWSGLAAAWFVATEVGAPLAPTLNELASALRDLGQTAREVQVALAGPVATARMVMALPVVGILFGLVLGYDTLGALFTTPIGLGCLLAGGLLMLLARAWNRRLIGRARSARETPGLALDLMAIALSGGGSIDRARAVVAEAGRRTSLGQNADDPAMESVLELSRRAGVPAAKLLRAEAEQARRLARSEGARKAATLAVTLMLPLGLCILPAFMLVGVAPLLIAIISSTVAAF